MTVDAIVFGLLALTRAARRANERGEVEERDRLLDEADAAAGRLIDAMPPDLQRRTQ